MQGRAEISTEKGNNERRTILSDLWRYQKDRDSVVTIYLLCSMRTYRLYVRRSV
jgi:hypothetical protein